MKDDLSLLYACAIDDIGLIEERVAHATPAQLKKSNQKYGTPLHAAALNGDRQAVDLLVAAEDAAVAFDSTLRKVERSQRQKSWLKRD